MGYKSYFDSTLRSMTKDDLIRLIRTLEHNWQGAEEALNNQTNSLQIMFRDYRPVKRGNWEYWRNNDYESGLHTAMCTNCHITQSVVFWRRKPTFEFCPHCGAKMDKEET